MEDRYRQFHCIFYGSQGTVNTVNGKGLWENAFSSHSFVQWTESLFKFVFAVRFDDRRSTAECAVCGER